MIRSAGLICWHISRPGSAVPGPPWHPILVPPPTGGAGLMDATSNSSLACDCARAPHANSTEPVRISIPRKVLRPSFITEFIDWLTSRKAHLLMQEPGRCPRLAPARRVVLQLARITLVLKKTRLVSMFDRAPLSGIVGGPPERSDTATKQALPPWCVDRLPHSRAGGPIDHDAGAVVQRPRTAHRHLVAALFQIGFD